MNCVTRSRARLFVRFGLVVLLAALLTPSGHGPLLDAWRADDLNAFDEGDAIGSWTSSGNRNAQAVSGAHSYQPSQDYAGNDEFTFVVSMVLTSRHPPRWGSG